MMSTKAKLIFLFQKNNGDQAKFALICMMKYINPVV